MPRSKKAFLCATPKPTSIFRSGQDSNQRGQTLMDFKSIALTTRPRLPSQHDETQKQWIYNSLKRIQPYFNYIIVIAWLYGWGEEEEKSLVLKNKKSTRYLL